MATYVQAIKKLPEKKTIKHFYLCGTDSLLLTDYYTRLLSSFQIPSFRIITVDLSSVSWEEIYPFLLMDRGQEPHLFIIKGITNKNQTKVKNFWNKVNRRHYVIFVHNENIRKSPELESFIRVITRSKTGRTVECNPLTDTGILNLFKQQVGLSVKETEEIIRRVNREEHSLLAAVKMFEILGEEAFDLIPESQGTSFYYYLMTNPKGLLTANFSQRDIKTNIRLTMQNLLLAEFSKSYGYDARFASSAMDVSLYRLLPAIQLYKKIDHDRLTFMFEKVLQIEANGYMSGSLELFVAVWIISLKKRK